MLVVTFVNGKNRAEYDVLNVKMAAMNRVLDESRSRGLPVDDMPDLTISCFDKSGRKDFLFRIFREVRFELKDVTDSHLFEPPIGGL